ncbi:MAG: glycoside hydrolase family 26 protein [Thermoleophilia bacterium]
MRSVPQTTARGARRALAAGLAGMALAAGLALAETGTAAAARIEVGVYQDNPVSTFAALRRASGPRATRVISTYVTGGKLVEPGIAALAKRNRARLLVTWMPDAGTDGARQPKYRLSSITRGRQDAGLRRLARQLASLSPTPILRPMPEPNTPWYAWSGTVNGNTPAAYAKAWARVRKVVRATPGGKRIKLLWAPYARSIPETPENAIAAYFPGAAQVDLVGASGYNFGATGALAWTDPAALFEDAYREISALAPKPFWIAETGSTAKGGSKADWLKQLARVKAAAIPNLAGIVWFDAKDGNGDFRVSSSKATRGAFKAFAARARAR